RLFLQSSQDIHMGGRQGFAEYQYTLLSDDLATLSAWTPKITEALENSSAIEDVSSDRQESGLDVRLDIDRATAARLGVDMSEVDNTLYDAFGQRPETLKDIYVSTSGGALSGTQSSAPASGAFQVPAGASGGNAASAAASA